MLRRDQKEGRIHSSIDDAHLQRRASNAGYHAQATSLLNRGLTTAQFNEFDSAITALEHPKGVGWTEKYGNLGSGKAAQRARNTKMNKPKVQTDKNTVVIDR
jgi:hypothetical protein